MDWNLEMLEAAKAALRNCTSLQEACDYLSRDFGAISRHSLRRAFMRNSLPNPSSYLNGGLEASFRGEHPNHKRIVEDPTPPGYLMKGVSTFYGADGTPKGQWVKTQVDQEQRIEALKQAIEKIADPISGLSDTPPTPKGSFVKNLMCVYPMGDPHIGMFAWHRETGENFDCKIAERDLFGAVDYLVGQAPAAETGLVVNLGDFFHSDNMDNKTRRSGHNLDVDGRFAQVIAVGLRTIRRCIDRALQKHKKVKVINAIGNHDDHTSMMLAITLAEYYSNNKRVEVETSPAAHHYHRFGKVLLGVTHGHTSKPERLQGVMAVDRAQDWGETLYRHWLTGHVHHDQMKELSGCTFESFRTLAAKDAYAAAHGYRSDRDMKCIVYHNEYGEVQRLTANIRLVRALLEGGAPRKRK